MKTFKTIIEPLLNSFYNFEHSVLNTVPVTFGNVTFNFTAQTGLTLNPIIVNGYVCKILTVNLTNSTNSSIINSSKIYLPLYLPYGGTIQYIISQEVLNKFA